MDYVRVEGSLLLPARVNGASDVFQRPQFTLVSPEWVPDEQSSYCELCSTKFSQLKRRHHCRMCGAIRCSKCCSEKIALPQLGIEEAERVCTSCRTVAELVAKARSSVETNIVEASRGLSAFTKHDKHVKKLVELGGTQTLVVLSSIDNNAVLGHVASGLHSLAIQPTLHKHLADSGAIKAICRILSHVGDAHEQAAVDGISALMIFCKSPNFKTKALFDGGLQPVLNLCWSSNATISLLSITTLGLIAEHPATHAAIFDNRQNAVSRLLQLSNAPDEQMQEVALKTLAILSTGTSDHRHRLIQEDTSSGGCLFRVLDRNPTNPQILCNAACLIANLATVSQDQTELRGFLQIVCQKLQPAEENTELLWHLTRALANFAQHKQNSLILTNAIPDVSKFCLKSTNAATQLQGMKLLVTLLAQAPHKVSSQLIRSGPEAFLMSLAEIPSILDSLQAALGNEAVTVSKPF